MYLHFLPKYHRILPKWKNWICKGLMNADNYTLYNVTNVWLTKSDYKLLSYLACSPPNFILQLLYKLSDHFKQYKIQNIATIRFYINIFHSIIVKHANNNYVVKNILLNLNRIKPK